MVDEILHRRGATRGDVLTIEYRDRGLVFFLDCPDAVPQSRDE